MKKLLLAAAAMVAVGAAAHASIIPTLTSVTPSAGDFTWLYQATLAGDQGLIDGSKLVILDFKGYVPGSIASSFAGFSTSVEDTTSGIILPLGYTDDASLTNLVFTYHGTGMNTSAGPFPPVDFSGLSAQSIYSDLAIGAFSAVAIKNNGIGPGGAGTTTFNTGSVTVPGAIPEPATWMMMVMGFGMLGAGLRLRRSTRAQPALG